MLIRLFDEQGLFQGYWDFFEGGILYWKTGVDILVLTSQDPGVTQLFKIALSIYETLTIASTKPQILVFDMKSIRT
jgi:hypothetical protein